MVQQQRTAAIDDPQQPKGLVYFYGLPAVGKSTLNREIAAVAAAEGIAVINANAGEYRRTHPEYSWLRTAEDFGKYPDVLDEISIKTLREGLDHTYATRGAAICTFDQTGTRKSSRDHAWNEVLRRDGLHMLVVDVHTSETREQLLRSFRDKVGNGDFKGMSVEEAVKDFSRRYDAYIQSATDYRDDQLFREHQFHHVRFDRYTGEIALGGVNGHGLLQDIVLQAIRNVDARYRIADEKTTDTRMAVGYPLPSVP